MTKTISVDEAQTHLLNLLSFAQKGNDVINVKDNKPIARIVSVSPSGKNRIAGLNKGNIWISNDFDAPLSDEYRLGAKWIIKCVS